MRTITIHVPEELYGAYQASAEESNRSAAELIRNAMEEYFQTHLARTGSIFDAPAADAGRILAPLSSEDDLLDEMLP
ncbi:CopG family ribbon-helix-helix protein [Salinispira pacifica]